ncbi:MAG: tocopherol cyclase family protein [Acidimicrobiia bacterium]|nr:tocopherol cyclase family protein [Acidimicrobiia bacterium]
MSFSPTLFHPERYHGHRRRPPFFEGWYFKLVDATETHRYAVIPGIFLSKDPDRHHAFIQILDGTTGQATYHRYPADEFRAATDRFEVEIGPSRFSSEGVVLDIADGDRVVKGEVRLGTPRPWPVSLTRLGIMGPYGWAPRMECNHGLVSFDHSLAGTLAIDGRSIDFDGGRGYGEKDWGKAFPAGYVWMQSNHFEQPGTSFVGSIAIIPWLFSAFPGFIIGLHHEGVLHQFATYTGAKTVDLHFTDETVEWTVADRIKRLTIRADRASGGLLYGPTRTDMSDRVGETMLSRVTVNLTNEAGSVIFAGTGRNAGLELHGDLERLLALQTDEKG